MELDHDKIDQARLHENGWISDPRGKASQSC